MITQIRRLIYTGNKRTGLGSGLRAFVSELFWFGSLCNKTLIDLKVSVLFAATRRPGNPPRLGSSTRRTEGHRLQQQGWLMGNDDVIKCQSWSGRWTGARLRVAVATRCQGNNATQPIKAQRRDGWWQVHCGVGSCGVYIQAASAAILNGSLLACNVSRV